MSGYDERLFDAEAGGDISLPSSHSYSSDGGGLVRPRSAAGFKDEGVIGAATVGPPRGPSRERERERNVSVPAPGPQRLFGRSLFSRSPNPSPSPLDTLSKVDHASHISSGTTDSTSTGISDHGRSISLNDDDEGTDQNVKSRPGHSAFTQAQVEAQAGPSRLANISEESRRRTRTADDQQTQAQQSSDSNHSGHAESQDQDRPSFQTRRTSSLGRSRSLNIHLPSAGISLDTSSSTIASRRTNSPMSATSISNPNAIPFATPSSKIGWSRRPGEPRPPPLVSEGIAKGMNRWIKEMVVCNFDLERGPVVERRAGSRRWGPGEKENVAFSSFPDTSLFSEGSILFSFKIRHIPPDDFSLSQPEPPSPMPDRVVKTVEEEMLDLKVGDPPGEAEVLPGGGNGSTVTANTIGLTASASASAVGGARSGPARPGDKAAEYRKWDERGREWLYGFVWFEQRRDKGITRGYMQKSLVILTHLPFPALFSAVLQKVAPAFFEYGYSALEAACHSIASWADPTPDCVLELPMMADFITVKLPDTTESHQIGKAFGISSSSLKAPILASLPTSTPLRAFASFLPSLWSLWECLILAEPVLIIAPDPKTCSEIVWWLRELLRPIPPAGDFRPYLHIHDHDFSLLVNSNKPQAGVVVGVTNPFFRNAASHWPNVISIPSQKPRRVAPNGASPAVAPSPLMKDAPEGFLSRRHRSVSKDRVLLKRLEALAAEGKLDDPEGNEALRTHFQQLTERFLVPLNRYFQTLVPTLSSPNPAPIPSPAPTPNSSSPAPAVSGHMAGSIKPFSIPSFLSHQKNHGPNPLSFRTKGLSTKSRVENDFYASFCMSPTFARWLEARVDSLGLALHANATSTTSTVGGNLTVPTRSQAHEQGLRTPEQRSPGQGSYQGHANGRPPLPRSVSASVGLGILGTPPTDSASRISPSPLSGAKGLAGMSAGFETGSESEVSRMSSETDSVRLSGEHDTLRQGQAASGHWSSFGSSVLPGPSVGRDQREREGSAATILAPVGWNDGRRASEGMVKPRGSIGR